MLISLACAFPFNPVSVIATPKMDATHAVLVAGQLLTTTPTDATERTRHMCDAIRERRDAIIGVMRVRKRPPKGLRPVLAALDHAWGGMEGRLSAAARLPDGGELAHSAEVLLTKVVPHGLGVLQVPTDEKHIESERMLAVIDTQGLAPEIDRVAGPGFLAAVRAAHEALTEAVGLGSAPVPYGPTDLHLGLSHLLVAMQLYVIQLAAEVDPGSEDSVRRFDAAVAPLVRARAERASSPPADDTTETDATDPSAATDPVTETTTTSNGTPALTNGAAHA